jgi:pimeloyl-[acyl-carrier protein] synthase
VTSVLDLVQRPQAVPDPYAVYHSLRERDPVLWVPELNRWLVTGHRQALAVLPHENSSSDRRNWDDYRLPEGLDRPPGGMVAADPPDHTRLRALVQQAFTPRLVERLRARVEELVDELLRDAAERGAFDLMTDFAAPLPAIVLAELLGVPAADHERFRRWSTTFIETLDPVSHKAVAEGGAQAYQALSGYLTEVFAARRAQPRDDLICGLLRAEADGARLRGPELLEMCLLLVVAGQETTANLLGNGVNALFQHPAQLRRLRTEPGLIGTAVEELLRYDAPIQVSGRAMRADLELDGHRLRKGQMVGVLLGAANRDPAAFADPDRLDLARRPNPHLGFGRGIHFCLGAPLARLEAGIALLRLVTRFPELRPAGTPVRRANVHVRGFASMPVESGVAVGGRAAL